VALLPDAGAVMSMDSRPPPRCCAPSPPGAGRVFLQLALLQHEGGHAAVECDDLAVHAAPHRHADRVHFAPQVAVRDAIALAADFLQALSICGLNLRSVSGSFTFIWLRTASRSAACRHRENARPVTD